MRGIEDMWFYADQPVEGRFVGRVREFSDLRTKAHKNKLDALDDIVGLTAQRIREIHERMNRR